MMETYVALDLETTGLSPEKDQILEIGALKVENGIVTDTYETLVQCPQGINMRIQELTGITDEMAATGITEARAVQELLEFCRGYVILGHNVPFDYGFVKAAALRCGIKYHTQVIDTLKIARKLLTNVEKKSLEYLCQHYHIETKASHRALEDARAAMELYKIMAQEFPQQQELFEPITVHKKIKKQDPITEAQKSYLKKLCVYHGLKVVAEADKLTKSEASRLIDEIIREHGRLPMLF